MDDIKIVFKAIKERSKFIITRGDEWVRRLGSATNYVCTNDLESWTFGKSVGDNGNYHKNGYEAKLRLLKLGFVDVLKFPDSPKKNEVISAFLNWAKKVKGYPIGDKFLKDQNASKLFEIYVHKDIVGDIDASDEIEGEETQKVFDEGFKKQIVIEVGKRDQKLIKQAKKEHGIRCSVCKMTFEEVYGEHGKGFIEMHHLYPVKGGERKNTVDDLRPVCANCHRMLHRGSELMSIEDLIRIVNEQKKKRRKTI
jgi:predicted HNH restriction endonuclease